MRIHQLTPQEAIASLNSHPDGLTGEEARLRLSGFGPNRVERISKTPLWIKFLHEFTHFFALILWIAAAMAFLGEWNDPGQGMAFLGFAVIGVILINGLFSFWQEYRAEKTLEALRELLPSMAYVLRDRSAVQVPADHVVPGDILLLKGGDMVSADCRLFEGFALTVVNATVTGEPLPLSREPKASGEAEFLKSKNILLAGTSVISGEGKAVVFATGMKTEFGKIARLTQSEGETDSPLRKEISFLTRVIVLLSAGIGLLFFFVGRMSGISLSKSLFFGIGLIVAMVPEGLLPTLTLALAMATQRMAKRNVLIRHLPAVEGLGSTTVICTDKTGTLTQNRMTVRQVYLEERCYSPDQIPGELAQTDTGRYFFLAAALCHNLRKKPDASPSDYIGDPMEISLARMAQVILKREPHSKKLDEIPFDADRKRMTALYEAEGECLLLSKGAPESTLPLCEQIAQNGKIVPLNPALRADLTQEVELLAESGLHVLAFACRTFEERPSGPLQEEGLVFLGLVGLEDPPRPEVPAAIQKCHEAGIRVIMVTGDHSKTALKIGREIGLIRSGAPRVILGEEMARMPDAALQLALDSPEVLFARVRADQKTRVVHALKQKQEIVAVTGDGVNDAPALKAADVGIAMGISGSDVARESADMVLLDDNFASIVSAIEEGRTVFENIRKFLTYILTHNIPELVPYLGFVLFKIPLPLTVIQILAIDLGTDTLPALGLGAERPDPGIMKVPPRRRTDRLFNLSLGLRAYLFLGLIESSGALTSFFLALFRGGWHWGEPVATGSPLYMEATAACLTAIVLMQSVNVFLCRSPEEPAFRKRSGTNALLLWGICAALGMILWIDYSSLGNRLFQTAPLSPEVWLIFAPLCGGLFLAEEIRKWIVRRFFSVNESL